MDVRARADEVAWRGLQVQRSFLSFDMATVKPYDHWERTVIVSSTLADLVTGGRCEIAAETVSRSFTCTDHQSNG